jgi:hypothetical protein
MWTSWESTREFQSVALGLWSGWCGPPYGKLNSRPTERARLINSTNQVTVYTKWNCFRRMESSIWRLVFWEEMIGFSVSHELVCNSTFGDLGEKAWIWDRPIGTQIMSVRRWLFKSRSNNGPFLVTGSTLDCRNSLHNAQIIGASTSFNFLINQVGVGSSRQLLAGRVIRRSRISFVVTGAKWKKWGYTVRLNWHRWSI